MDPRLITVVAGAVTALIGLVLLAPDLFGFLRLPAALIQLGLERLITGFALLLLGVIGVLTELDPQPKRRKGAHPLAIQPALEPGPADVPAPAHDAFDAPLNQPMRGTNPVPERDIRADEPEGELVMFPTPQAEPELPFHRDPDEPTPAA